MSEILKPNGNHEISMEEGVNGNLKEGDAVLSKDGDSSFTALKNSRGWSSQFSVSFLQKFLELVEASRVAKEVKHPFRNLPKRRNCPQLITAVVMQVFQQFRGINAIMFYAPVLFNTLGFKNDASLYSAIITGAVNVVSTMVVIYAVDKVQSLQPFQRRQISKLYTSVVPRLIYAAMGSSRESHPIGSVAVVLLLLSSMLQKVVYPADPLAYRKLAFTATLFAGVFQSTFGLCKIESINLACH